MCDTCEYIASRGGQPGDPVLTRQWERRWLARTCRTVATDGWLVMSVEAGDGRPVSSYTIGLWCHGHPDLIIFGLDQAVAAPLLNVVADDVLGGRAVDERDELGFAGWHLKVLPLVRPAEVMPRAARIARSMGCPPLRGRQLVYPDVHGTWPWEPDCHLPRGAQPMPGVLRE